MSKLGRARWLLGGVAALALIDGPAATGDEKKVGVKGHIQGGDTLLNPVWNEAKDPKSHRYSFRTPSTSVGKQAKRLTAHLPKELCIAALHKEGGGTPRGTPVPVGVSGGRTSPVTLVVSEGTPVQFINYDPFPHRLFDSGKDGGFGPEDMKPGGSRTWKPPKSGTFEIRDALFPSVRSWVVVEPRTAQTTYPTLAGDYAVHDLDPGAYEFQAYFMGKAVGKPLSFDVKKAPDEQEIRDPLVVGEKKDDEK